MKRYRYVIINTALPSNFEAWVDQVDNWKTRQHPNLVAYCGSIYIPDHRTAWIVMEYCAIGSVADVMSITNKTLNEAQIAIVCKSMLKGLEYLVASDTFKHLRYGDLRTSTVLLTDKGEVKLGNYFDSEATSHFAYRRRNMELCREVLYWVPPEVLNRLALDKKTSVWSLGITLIQMSEGRNTSRGSAYSESCFPNRSTTTSQLART
eukprot:TRINITY_DN1221_c0_g1_i1.p1 TRINITY_DN1221_c0_g1~~TRINITY_DN1221_c0_g1_i1.p1  ORF type:complete len:207 (+),score=11.89 TRINITY_DN1221_c0_g1_i1:403-1023(+)